MKPDINSVEIHLQLSDDGHPVDGALLGDASLWPPHPTDKSASSFSVLLQADASLPSLCAHRQTGLAMSTGYSGPDIICRSVLPVSASQWFFWNFPL